MGGFSPGTAGYYSSAERRFRHQQMRNNNVAELMLGLGTMVQALGERRRRSEEQANEAVYAERLAQMQANPEGQSFAVPPHGGMPGGVGRQPWESAIGQEVAQYRPATAIENFGRTFNIFGRPEGQLTPRAATSLIGEARAAREGRAAEAREESLLGLRAREVGAREAEVGARAGRVDEARREERLEQGNDDYQRATERLTTLASHRRNVELALKPGQVEINYRGLADQQRRAGDEEGAGWFEALATANESERTVIAERLLKLIDAREKEMNRILDDKRPAYEAYTELQRRAAASIVTREDQFYADWMAENGLTEDTLSESDKDEMIAAWEASGGADR